MGDFKVGKGMGGVNFVGGGIYGCTGEKCCSNKDVAGESTFERDFVGVFHSVIIM